MGVIFMGLGGVGKIVKGGQKLKFSSYKINKSWEYYVHYGDYS